MQRSRQSRTTETLSEPVHQLLSRYAVAASAAGVGVLALTQSAQAKIVYTPAHLKLYSDAKFPIDFNHDGHTDFQFYQWVYGSSAGFGSGLTVANSYAPPSNAVVATGSLGGHQAVAIKAGESIGPHRNFASGGRMGTVNYSFNSHKRSWKGPWANGGRGLKDRYVGVKFVIGTEMHYGWARVSMKISDNKVEPTLTGYAYETIANKPIIAGKTSGPDAMTVHPATLGNLAAGSK